MTTRDRPRYPRRSDARSLAVVLAHFVFVFAPVFLAAWVGPGRWLPVLWLWFGLSFHGMLNLWHESSHALVFRERWKNELLGRWILAPLIVGDFEAYRSRHWDHHRFVGREEDTKDAYLLDLHGTRMLRFLLDCLTLREARKKLCATTGPPDEAPRSRGWPARAALGQVVLLAGLLAVALARGRSLESAMVAAGAAWAFVYLYGTASLTLFVATLRSLAEHGLSDDGSPRIGRAALRNFASGPVERLLLGAYGFAEHATHHREPAIPAYHLPAATARLVAEGAHELRPQPGGYRARLRDVLRG